MLHPAVPIRRSPALTRGSAAGLFRILLGQRMVRGLGRPGDAQHPPALAVVEQLDRVDAAEERLFVRQLLARLESGEYVRDVAEAVHGPGDLLLVGSFALEEAFVPFDIGVRRSDPGVDLAALGLAGRDHSGAWIEE